MVGSALVGVIKDNLDADGAPLPGTAAKVLDLVRSLADGVRAAKK